MVRVTLTRLMHVALLLMFTAVDAADVTFINIRQVYKKPQQAVTLHRYAINLASYPSGRAPRAINDLGKLDTAWAYLATVNIGRNVFDRLVIGNYATLAQARAKLKRVKQWYPGAWINHREKAELKAVQALIKPRQAAPPPRVTPIKPPTPPTPARTPRPVKQFPDLGSKLLDEAEQKLIDGSNARVIVLSNKINEVGTVDQKQKAMELAGLARERQGKFAQAVRVYREFLKAYPKAESADRIKSRLEGLVTMNQSPKQKLANEDGAGRTDWNVYGSLSQFYRNARLAESGADDQELNSSLVSDINLVARKKSDTTSLALSLDGGLVNDFLAKEDNGRISRAMVSYSDNVHAFQLTGGRQVRTAKGVLGRFDGIVFKGLAPKSFDYSLYLGSPVYSTYDGIESDRQFIGASVHFKPFAHMLMDIYLVTQEQAGLTDRQAVGGEFQYLHERGFLFGLVDYDVFYEDINHLTAIGSYQTDQQWTLNLTYDFRNSPQLTTLNAIQGQAVTTLDELKQVFTEDEIYQLAEDRTAKSHNLQLGASSAIDAQRSLYLNLSLTALEDTPQSGGVDDTPSSNEIHLAADYTIQGYFTANDFTSFGVGLSDTDTASILSLRARSRFLGGNGFRYDPRVRIDYRAGNNTGVDQWILKPSFKLIYQPSKNLSLEASLGVEHSTYDLPDLNDQTIYDFFLGYLYRF